MQKQNSDGLYVTYTHLVNYYLEKKSFLEAIDNIDALIEHLEDFKKLMTSSTHFNTDDLTLINLKLFYNYYRSINMRKKFLIMQDINKRP